ncbi:hypothetical protein RKD37_004803 [Streptomyces ambofaciens]
MAPAVPSSRRRETPPGAVVLSAFWAVSVLPEPSGPVDPVLPPGLRPDLPRVASRSRA